MRRLLSALATSAASVTLIVTAAVGGEQERPLAVGESERRGDGVDRLWGLA
ncbi:hypothetical protein GCM10027610_066710 [Dactylosporangium cerinum]